MGQKVSPHGLRVGVIKDWDSKWYANKKDFADYLVEDKKIREFVKRELYAAGISKILIERAAEDKVKPRLCAACVWKTSRVSCFTTQTPASPRSPLNTATPAHRLSPKPFAPISAWRQAISARVAISKAISRPCKTVKSDTSCTRADTPPTP